jgi:hypothetical protein
MTDGHGSMKARLLAQCSVHLFGQNFPNWKEMRLVPSLQNNIFSLNFNAAAFVFIAPVIFDTGIFLEVKCIVIIKFLVLE